MSYQILKLFLIGKTLSITIAPASYEPWRATTALRIIYSALNQGYNVDVFVYGTERDLKEEDDYKSVLFGLARDRGVFLSWIVCNWRADVRQVESARASSDRKCIELVQSNDEVVVIQAC